MIIKILRGALFLVPLILSSIGTFFLYINDHTAKNIIDWIFRGAAISIVTITLLMALLVVYSWTKLAVALLFKVSLSKKINNEK